MANFCNVISVHPAQKHNCSTSILKFNELEFKILVYEMELLNLHDTFNRQSEFISNCYFDVCKNEDVLIEIENNMKIQQDAVKKVEILIYSIENDLNGIELIINEIFHKLGSDCEFINVPVTIRGNIYLSLFIVTGCMNQMYDEINEFYKQSSEFVARNNITTHILNIHVSLVFCLEKNIAKLLDMIEAINQMFQLLMIQSNEIGTI